MLNKTQKLIKWTLVPYFYALFATHLSPSNDPWADDGEVPTHHEILYFKLGLFRIMKKAP